MMNRDDVKEVFKIIKYAYSKFEVSAGKVDTWHRLLKDQDSDVVIHNTEKFVLNNKFPPTIADLREVKTLSRDKSFVDKVKEWERNATGNKH